MKTKALLLNMVILWATLSGCIGQINPSQSAQTCPDLTKVVEAFYAANDASQFATSLQYLTDDIAVVSWAEGANGHHMIFNSTVGKDQIEEFLNKPGLKRTAAQPGLPNYTMQAVQRSGVKVSFKLMPDRVHPDKRPYNPFYVEAFFSGCQIELLKVVERVTWL
jgi:hypothetical protein